MRAGYQSENTSVSGEMGWGKWQVVPSGLNAQRSEMNGRTDVKSQHQCLTWRDGEVRASAVCLPLICPSAAKLSVRKGRAVSVESYPTSGYGSAANLLLTVGKSLPLILSSFLLRVMTFG